MLIRVFLTSAGGAGAASAPRQVFECESCHSGVLDIQLLMKHVTTCKATDGEGKETVRSPVFSAKPAPKDMPTKASNQERVQEFVEACGGEVAYTENHEYAVGYTFPNGMKEVGVLKSAVPRADGRDVALGYLCAKLEALEEMELP